MTTNTTSDAGRHFAEAKAVAGRIEVLAGCIRKGMVPMADLRSDVAQLEALMTELAAANTAMRKALA